MSHRAARSRLRGLAAGALVLLVATLPLSLVPALATESPDPTVIGVRVIGHSVEGRNLVAYQLGVPSSPTTVVAIAAIHGNENAASVSLRRIRGGAPIGGVNLWLIPRANPDGVVRRSRHNARGVDLNRNFPTRWQATTGYYNSGPRPGSEPETRALMRFLDRVDPDHVVSFHQPLYGVDTSGRKHRAFAVRLATELALPRDSFTCSGSCHGTLTQWFNAQHRGANVTVEFGADPTSRYLRVRAPSGLLRAIGAER